MRKRLRLVAMACAFAWMPACTSHGSTGVSADAGSGEASDDAALPRPSTEDPTVLKGWSAALQRGCPSCHQSADAGVLSGQSDPVPGTTTYGSNLTPDPDTGMDAWDASAIVDALRKGIDNQGQPLCPAMPRYGDMSDDEASALAAYLQTLAAVHNAIPDSVCPPVKPIDAGAEAATDGGDDGADGVGDDGAGDTGPADGADGGSDSDAAVDAAMDVGDEG